MEQGTLFPPFQRHSATSFDAAMKIATSTTDLRQRAYALLLMAGDHGLTDEEGIRLMGRGDTYRPRRIELTDAGLVYGTGRERISTRGCMMEVWAAYPV